MDGHGTMLWQRDVFRALRGEPPHGAPSPLSGDEVRAKIAAGLGAERPAHDDQPEGPQWRSALGRIPTGPRRSMWRRRTISGVHPGGPALIARQLALSADGVGLIEFAVDLRRLVPEARFTGGARGTVPVRVGADDDWASVGASLLAGLDGHLYLRHAVDPAVPLMPLPLVRDLRTWIDTIGRLSHDMVRELKLAQSLAVVEHLGTVRLADFSGGGFTATSFYCLGGIGPAPEVNVVECGTQTEVTVSWRGGRGVAERADALLDRIEQGLAAAVPGPSPRGTEGPGFARVDSAVAQIWARTLSVDPDVLNPVAARARASRRPSITLLPARLLAARAAQR
jgi:hypothetical protein